MNFLSSNPDTGEFYLIGVFMREDGRYGVSAIYLHPDGSFRTKGGDFWFDTKPEAQNKCRDLQRVKRRMKNFHTTGIKSLPAKARRYLKADIDTYVSQEEMLQMIREAEREYYVEFECVAGIEGSFDEGVEYLALRDAEDQDFYDVYDRNGQLVTCCQQRFSRLEPTERALRLGFAKAESGV